MLRQWYIWYGNRYVAYIWLACSLHIQLWRLPHVAQEFMQPFTLMVNRTKAVSARTQPYCGFVACWAWSEWKWNDSLNFKVKWSTASSLCWRSSQVLGRDRNSIHLCTCTVVRTLIMYKSVTACCSHFCHFSSIRWRNNVQSRRTTFSLQMCDEVRVYQQQLIISSCRHFVISQQGKEEC